MREGMLRRYLIPILLAVVIAGGGSAVVVAKTSSSDNYQVTETEFGGGSTLESCSGQFCAKASIGNMSGGASKSPTSTASFGPETGSEPLLEVIVDSGTSNLGTLSADQTMTKTMVVRVRTHLSSGYTLQINGNPPKYKGHTLKSPTTPTASQAGTEQFAINAVANTIPGVGADPAQVPSNQTSFGAATSDYNTSNLFKYLSGDIIAQSQSESGRTDYTVSMIVNISNSTPAGHYTGDFSAIVTPVY